MTIENLAITETNNLPIKHKGKVHNGKVRSAYWLKKEDSKSIAEDYGLFNQDLGIMVISDRISAFECLWQSKGGLNGIPGKGASLNAISKYWFDEFETSGLTGNHIIDNPHPLVWIVQKAEPVMIEAIARQYITGSMWRAYNGKGAREFCGIKLPEGLKQNQKLEELLLTPSTKGILKGISGVPEQDDVNITRKQIEDNYTAFGFKSLDDIDQYEKLVREGFALIDRKLDDVEEVFVDTKFELGYLKNSSGEFVMSYIDEVGTPDSSRYWNKKLYNRDGTVEEDSKEEFRQGLLDSVPDADLLTNKERMDERVKFAETYRVPDRVFSETSILYSNLAEKITGMPIVKTGDVRTEIIESLRSYGIIEE